MNSLTFESIDINCGHFGRESVVPDIFIQNNLQNKTKFDLDEFDEIYEGYGQVPNAYPYRQQNQYNRYLSAQKVNAAILENDLMRAVFLPEFGGRLWELYDKKNKTNVVYSNDCIRASNLAVRNAWFSGGVEWNCGIIGHSPFTMDKVFAASVQKDGLEILRMYAYERIRGIVYQMEFWLDDERPALNCHMSVYNPTSDVVPMYWWTNIASPMYPEGRVLVPAHKAYTYKDGKVRKVDIPNPDEKTDVSHYESIPVSTDYFFSLDDGAPKWIANVDQNGHGMLHLSTDRLQSRKLFVWGQTDGAWHWQDYLTDHCGPYIELQAGLGKTQYGCIPMAPHTTWEWSERFTSLSLSEKENTMDFEHAVQSINAKIRHQNIISKVNELGRQIRTMPGSVVMEGTGDGELQDLLREHYGLKPMRTYLDFKSHDERTKPWKEFLNTGIVTEPSGFPMYDLSGSEWLALLEECSQKPERRNWYLYYCISLLQYQAGRSDLAMRNIRKSMNLRENACNLYVYAVCLTDQGNRTQATNAIFKGIMQSKSELSYVKAGLELLASIKEWKKIVEIMPMLPSEIRENSRVKLYYIRGLFELFYYDKAMQALEENGGLQLEDIREGEIAMGSLWKSLSVILGREKQSVPYIFDFNSMYLE